MKAIRYGQKTIFPIIQYIGCNKVPSIWEGPELIIEMLHFSSVWNLNKHLYKINFNKFLKQEVKFGGNRPSIWQGYFVPVKYQVEVGVDI